MGWVGGEGDVKGSVVGEGVGVVGMVVGGDYVWERVGEDVLVGMV